MAPWLEEADLNMGKRAGKMQTGTELGMGEHAGKSRIEAELDVGGCGGSRPGPGQVQPVRLHRAWGSEGPPPGYSTCRPTKSLSR
jgi:hypothetical protein